MEERFEYTYSAPQRSEVLEIRQKYLPKEVTKLEQLKALDESVTKRGSVVSLVHGILFTLLLGFGMSCCLVWGGQWFVPGIVIGCLGLLGVALTFPIYRRVVTEDREQLAPEILRLSDELILES